MTRIHAFENFTQIKTATFVAQIKMALHRRGGSAGRPFVSLFFGIGIFDKERKRQQV